MRRDLYEMKNLIKQMMMLLHMCSAISIIFIIAHRALRRLDILKILAKSYRLSHYELRTNSIFKIHMIKPVEK